MSFVIQGYLQEEVITEVYDAVVTFAQNAALTEKIYFQMLWEKAVRWKLFFPTDCKSLC